MIIVSCSVVIALQNKVLLVKETKTVAKERWNFPGGKLEQGESVFDCAKRETLEEAGIVIDDLKLIEIVNKPESSEGNNVVKFIFVASVAETKTDHELERQFFTLEEIEEKSRKNQIRGSELSDVIRRVIEGNTKVMLSIRK
jgi:ADP-ribose pyrophosphatase YjhB (NUDIX family)